MGEKKYLPKNSLKFSDGLLPPPQVATLSSLQHLMLLTEIRHVGNGMKTRLSKQKGLFPDAVGGMSQ